MIFKNLCHTSKIWLWIQLSVYVWPMIWRKLWDLNAFEQLSRYFYEIKFVSDWNILIIKELLNFDALDKCIHEYVVKVHFQEIL